MAMGGKHKSFSVTLRCRREAAASKGDGPVGGRASFEARSLCSLAPQDDGLSAEAMP
jgi:hypothetical protein